MTLLEAIDSAKVQESPQDYFIIREAHREHIKAPSWRLRAQLLARGSVSLEDDTGDGYRFHAEDVRADDWLVLPNEAAA